MTRAQLEHEFERLAEGFNVVVRAVRVDAFYKRFGYHRHGDLVIAVDMALLDPRFPSGERLAELLDRQIQDRHRHEHEQREAAARKLFAGGFDAPTPLGQFYAKAIPQCMAAPYGQYPAWMRDRIASWVAADPSRDKYFSEAQYWAELADLSVIERRTRLLKELKYDPGDGYDESQPAPTQPYQQRQFTSHHYGCSKPDCMGNEDGCDLAPNGCGKDARWQAPQRVTEDANR